MYKSDSRNQSSLEKEEGSSIHENGDIIDYNEKEHSTRWNCSLINLEECQRMN